MVEKCKRSRLLTTMAGVVKKNSTINRKLFIKDQRRYQNREEMAKFPLCKQKKTDMAISQTEIFDKIPVDLFGTRSKVYCPTVRLKERAQARRSRIGSAIPTGFVIQPNATSLTVRGERYKSNAHGSFECLKKDLPVKICLTKEKSIVPWAFLLRPS